jgi:hypothetical protein
MWILIKVVDTASVKRRRPAFYAMDHVSFLEQEFCEVCAILTGSAGNQSHSF